MQAKNSDKEIREALQKAMEEYKATADERAMATKHDRAIAFATYRKDLRKLDTMHRIVIGGIEPGDD